MKKVIMGFILVQMFWSTTLLAKERYKVTIISQHSQNKSLGSVALFVGGFVFDVVANAVANTETVKKIASDIEKFIYHNGLNQEEILDRFGDKIKISVIDRFRIDKYTYRVSEKIKFDINLKQDAYTYIINVSKDKSCIIFPNEYDTNNRYRSKREYRLPSSTEYNFKSNRAGREIFYLVTSPKDINLDSMFNKDSCIESKNRWNTILDNLKKEALIDIGRIDLTIVR